MHKSPMGSADSGGNSPDLWKNISPSPPKSPSHPLLGHHHWAQSPESRAEAIARGQWELMEMVKNMPESSYELSLRDLVEYSHEIKRDDDHNQGLHQRVKPKRSEEQRKRINTRKLSFGNKGMFLNMVFPFSLQFKKNKKEKKKVSNNGEREWWKKRFKGSSDSDSSRTSNNSGGSTTTTTTTVSSCGGSSGSSTGRGRKRNGLLTGCWPFFRSDAKGKSME